MAKNKGENGEEGQEPQDIEALLVKALTEMPQEKLRAILGSVGAIPTTMGMTPEHIQVLMGGLQANSAEAMRQALRSQRKENPSYPERSAFFPQGVYDNDGVALPAKLKLTRPVLYCGVRLGGELETEEEIRLLNAFTESKTARDGRWTAEIIGRGTSRERLIIDLPAKTLDERMSLPSMAIALRELQSGPDAVNPETLTKTIEAMQKKIAELERAQPVGVSA